MKRGMLRWTLVFAILLALVYGGDYCSVRFQIPGHRPRLGQVTVNILYVIHVKGGKIQYEPGNQETDTCVHSLLPHLGYVPCWYLNRHTDKRIEL